MNKYYKKQKTRKQRKKRIVKNSKRGGTIGFTGNNVEGDTDDFFICPITREIFIEPVVASDGHTYEKNAIEHWFSLGKRTSPKTNQELSNTITYPNQFAKSIIQEMAANNQEFRGHYEETKLNWCLTNKSIFDLIRQGNLECVRLWLDSSSIDVNQADIEGQTPLFIATKGRHIEIVRMLLEKDEINVNQTEKSGFTTLMLACIRGYIEIVRMLLDKDGINVNQRDPRGLNPLGLACYKGHANIVELLLQHKDIDVNQALINTGATALLIACEKGNVDIVKLLLQHEDIDLNKANKGGKTPIYFAIYYEFTEIKELLSQKFAEQNQNQVASKLQRIE